MNKNQKGFAALEGLLIIVIVTIIGGTGYYVWHSKQQTDKTLDSAAKTSQTATATKKSSSANASYTQDGDWVWYENKQLGFKFKFPKKWNQNDSSDFVRAAKSNGFAEYPGCGTPQCAVKYNASNAKWYNSDNTISSVVSTYAEAKGLTAYATPVIGDLNCGKFDMAIPYKDNMIEMALGMCTKPISTDEHTPPSGSLIYEDEVTNMNTTLSSFTDI